MPDDALARCANCGVERTPARPGGTREPCFNCGATSIRYEVALRGSVNFAGVSEVAGRGEVQPVSVAVVEAPPRLSLLGLPVDYAIEVCYTELSDEDDPACLIEILSGGVVLATGGGLTPADALSVMFERMLPPSSTERIVPDDDPIELGDE